MGSRLDRKINSNEGQPEDSTKCIRCGFIELKALTTDVTPQLLTNRVSAIKTIEILKIIHSFK